MALRGRAIPNRPIIGRAQSAAVAAAAIQRFSFVGRPNRLGRPTAKAFFSRPAVPAQAAFVAARTSYIVRPTDLIYRPKAKATYGPPQFISVAPPAPIQRVGYFVRPVFTGRPKAKATFGIPQRIAVAAPPVQRFSFIGKPVFTGRPRARATFVRLQTAPQPVVQPPIHRSLYRVKPVFTGRRPVARATYGLLPTYFIPPLGQSQGPVYLARGDRSLSPRMARNMEILSEMFNSLSATGQLVRDSQGNWKIVPQP